MPEQKEEVIQFDRLVSGDRPSLYILGMVAAESLKVFGVAAFGVDKLGRVVVMPPSSVFFKIPPRVPDDDLNKLGENEAIEVMVSQGDSEQEIIEYLKRREPQNKENNDGESL